jgi:hypothetical protein
MNILDIDKYINICSGTHQTRGKQQQTRVQTQARTHTQKQRNNAVHSNSFRETVDASEPITPGAL